MTIIKPMLASPTTKASNRQEIRLESLKDHAYELKIDGLRAVLYWDGSTLVIRNRSGVDITPQFPDIEATASVLGPKPVILDGELVCDDGKFTSVATRGKQANPAAVARAVREHPAQFIAFDVLAHDGGSMLAAPYLARRQMLELLGTDWVKPFQPVIMSLDGPMLWQHVHALGLEGLIAKRLASTYQPGARSRDWLKFKTVRRVTCVAVGYEKGEGARAHFGAMHLAMIGPKGPVSVGRVGTGFNEAEIWDLKGRCDRAELFLVEIEALNRTKDGQLRFPVYKGIRTDLEIADATLDQLDILPLC